LPVQVLGPLTGLSAALQRYELRHSLAPLTRMPDTDQWAGWEALRDATQDALPLLRLADGELHIDQDCILSVPAGCAA
ncbi:TilS substrate-binding domain-containing protein, partial [Pseudomonas syringae pv. tagetis]|uniref:TilS substrate-binding domain-containing protein n=1 Tax=Pseudomonas syringae group genomosp. 7 TaxID=251699 RepID=UPI00376F6492